MPKVYLIAQPSLSRDGVGPQLHNLAQYGELRVLLEAGERPYKNPRRCRDLIKDRLANFNPDEDFIVWAGGDTLAAVLTGIVLEQLELDNVCWLRFTKRRTDDGEWVSEGSYYEPVDVPLWDEAA